MRFAIFSDQHGNLEATEAVLQDAQEKECTHFVCLGDLVGYNANPHECVELVRKMDCPVVKGNHDEQACLSVSSRDFNALAEEAIDWTRNHLTEADKEWLADLRLTRQVRDFTIVHATLDTPGEQWRVVDITTFGSGTNVTCTLTPLTTMGSTSYDVRSSDNAF